MLVHAASGQAFSAAAMPAPRPKHSPAAPGKAKPKVVKPKAKAKKAKPKEHKKGSPVNAAGRSRTSSSRSRRRVPPMSPPPGTEELPMTASGNEEGNTPTASGQDAAPVADQVTASGQEDPGDAAESASAGPGEHKQGDDFEADWSDPNAGDQTGIRDDFGPDEEDATASGQVRGESHGSNDETIFPLAEAAPPKSFPGFPTDETVFTGDDPNAGEQTGNRDVLLPWAIDHARR